MNNIKLIYLSLWLWVCFSGTINAQDIQFSQIYQADLLLNPAFAGRDYRNRIMSHSRLQWPNASAPYTTTFFSFDKYLHKYKSGVGVMALYDRQGPGTIQSYEIHSIYTYELHLSEEIALRMALQGGVVRRVLSDEGLIYPDQLSDDGISSGASRLNTPSTVYPDFGGSFLFFTPKLWFGLNVGHLNSPQFSFFNDNNRLPERYTAIFGYKFDLSRPHATSYEGFVKDFYIYPLIHYKHQGKLDQVEIGAYGIDDQFLFGLFYRGIPFKKYNDRTHNNESIITLVGWKYGPVSFTYSYDWIISELTPAAPRGAHEINITYVFPRNPKHKPPKMLPCPNFNKDTGLF